MCIQVTKHINKDANNRVEYLFIHFDYFDGIDLIAKLLSQEYHMSLIEKLDGIWYSIIKVKDRAAEYELVWHEDVGNYIFSLKQDEKSLSELERKLVVIVRKLNEMLKP